MAEPWRARRGHQAAVATGQLSFYSVLKVSKIGRKAARVLVVDKSEKTIRVLDSKGKWKQTIDVNHLTAVQNEPDKDNKVCSIRYTDKEKFACRALFAFDNDELRQEFLGNVVELNPGISIEHKPANSKKKVAKASPPKAEEPPANSMFSPPSEAMLEVAKTRNAAKNIKTAAPATPSKPAPDTPTTAAITPGSGRSMGIPKFPVTQVNKYGFKLERVLTWSSNRRLLRLVDENNTISGEFGMQQVRRLYIHQLINTALSVEIESGMKAEQAEYVDLSFPSEETREEAIAAFQDLKDRMNADIEFHRDWKAPFPRAAWESFAALKVCPA